MARRRYRRILENVLVELSHLRPLRAKRLIQAQISRCNCDKLPDGAEIMAMSQDFTMKV